MDLDFLAITCPLQQRYHIAALVACEAVEMLIVDIDGERCRVVAVMQGTLAPAGVAVPAHGRDPVGYVLDAGLRLDLSDVVLLDELPPVTFGPVAVVARPTHTVLDSLVSFHPELCHE